MKRLVLLLASIVTGHVSYTQIPTIISFSPTSGIVGSEVIITGTNFSETPENNIVYFGAAQATVNSSSESSLNVIVPAGATYQPITVTNDNLTAYSVMPFTTTQCSVGLLDTTAMLPKVDYLTYWEPLITTVADFDGDGKSDLAVGYRYGNEISIFQNISSEGIIDYSSLDAEQKFETGYGPSSIAVGDIDGDGRLDLAVSNSQFGGLSVLQNTSAIGIISFDSQVEFETGYEPRTIIISDLDADGKPDIVITSRYENLVSVFHNTSVSGVITESSFADRVDFETFEAPGHIAIGDIDSDGKLDLVVTSENYDSVSVYRNISSTGSINESSFMQRVNFEVEGEYDGFDRAIAIADLDSDSKPDLIIAGGKNHTISILKNISTSGIISSESFDEFIYIESGEAPGLPDGYGYVPANVTVGDIDGDNKPDIAVSKYFDGQLLILKNSTESGSITTDDFVKLNFDAPNCWGISIVDMDGDTKQDVIVTNPGTAYLDAKKISIFKNNSLFIPAICMVSVDSFSLHNIIYWDKTVYPSADSFIVYRETFSNIYERIGSASKDEMSLLVDTTQNLYFPFTGDPNTGTYRYKLQITDTCGNYSSLSPYHNTLFVTKTDGTFNWNDYQIENQPIPINEISAYYLYRDDESNGIWNVINAVSSSQLTMNDPDYASYPNGSWRIEAAGSLICDPSLFATNISDSRSVTTSFSNVVGVGVSGIGDIIEDQLKVNIYPNPAHDELKINVAQTNKENIILVIQDLMGKKLFEKEFMNETNYITIGLGDLSSGVYLLNVNSKNNYISQKFVKE